MGTQFAHKGSALGATETTETDLGDITVPNGVSRITGISACCAIETGTAGDGALGHSRLSWAGAPELDGIPVGIAVMEELGGSFVPQYLPVNIPIKALTTVHCYMTLTVAQGGACYGLISLRFE